MGDVIQVDFAPKKEKCEIIEFTSSGGQTWTFTPDAESLDDATFDINYLVQPCLFGWEAIIFKNWAFKPYALPDFFSSQVAAEANAEAHRLEELTKIDSAFDLILDELDE
jgi:hypothetical protein